MAVQPATSNDQYVNGRSASAPWLFQRRGTAWRAPLAAAGIITAAAHIPVTGEHLHEALYIGVLFILLEIASVVLAAALIRRPSRAVLLAIAVVGFLAVLAFVWSRAIGLPLIGDDIGNWTEPLAVVSVAAESVMTVGGLIAALGRAEALRGTVLAGLVAGVLLLVVGAVATGVASVAESAGDTDSGSMPMGLSAAPHISAPVR